MWRLWRSEFFTLILFYMGGHALMVLSLASLDSVAQLASAMAMFSLCSNVDSILAREVCARCGRGQPSRPWARGAMRHATLNASPWQTMSFVHGPIVPTNQMHYDTKWHFLENIFVYSNIITVVVYNIVYVVIMYRALKYNNLRYMYPLRNRPEFLAWTKIINYNTCLQVPRFVSGTKSDNLSGDRMHSHLQCDALWIELPSLGSKAVGRNGKQLLVLDVHFLKVLWWNTSGWWCCHLWCSASCCSHQAQLIKGSLTVALASNSQDLLSDPLMSWAWWLQHVPECQKQV